MFNVSLAILNLLKDKLINLDLDEITEYFREFIDDDLHENSILPDYEAIIEEAYSFDISNTRIDQILNRHKPS